MGKNKNHPDRDSARRMLVSGQVSQREVPINCAILFAWQPVSSSPTVMLTFPIQNTKLLNLCNCPTKTPFKKNAFMHLHTTPRKPHPKTALSYLLNLIKLKHACRMLSARPAYGKGGLPPSLVTTSEQKTVCPPLQPPARDLFPMTRHLVGDSDRG